MSSRDLVDVAGDTEGDCGAPYQRRDRARTPIIDAVRRQRGEFQPYGKPEPVDPWAPAFPGHATPEQKTEANRILAGRDPLTLEK